MAEQKQVVFKKKVRIFDRRSLFFSVIVLLMFAGLCVLIINCKRLCGPGSSSPASGMCPVPGSQQSWSAEQDEEYANKLASKGLKGLAVRAYEDYLENSGISSQRRAKICYRIADLYLDMAEYEKALGFLYRVEIEYPGTELSAEIGEKIVNCLENIGMVSQARYELESRTGLGQAEDNKGSVVIARVGKNEITQAELDQALERLQPWVKKQFSSEEGTLEFARQFVATEVLYSKAKRLGYDKDPEVRLQIENILKQLLVRKIMEKELNDKVKINPADVELYYQANKDKYVEQAQVKLSYLNTDSEEKINNVLEQLNKGDDFSKAAQSDSVEKMENIEQWIDVNSPIPEIGSSEQIWEQISKTAKGENTGKIEYEDRFYCFLIRDNKESRQKGFEEVKDQVAYEYRSRREQEATQALLESVLEEQDVQLYLEKIKSSAE